MKLFKIKEDVLKAVIQYLASKPWGETNHLIESLRRIEPIEAEKENPIEEAKEAKDV
jgi:hypothetical protein